MVESKGLSYGDYLQLDKILNAQTCQSEINGELVHDEHLFIVIHQAYELWFKQVIFEIDSIRKIFQQDIIEEALMLEVNKRLQRVVMIAKHLADQVLILETMTPLDFMDFRDHLSTASGFQSLQFRLIENKLGVKSEHRVRYNRSNYRDVYKEKEKEMEQLIKSEEDPSLFDLIERWLMRTPGSNVNDDFCFSKNYQAAINVILEDSLKDIENESNPKVREVLLTSYKKKKEQYSSIFDQEKHDSLVARGERRLSFEALHGALMISLYREEPIFHPPAAPQTPQTQDQPGFQTTGKQLLKTNGAPFTTIYEAEAEAKKTKKPIMFLIHRTTCPSCKALIKTISRDKEFTSKMSGFLLADIEDDVDDKKADSYDVDGGYVPRIYFLDPEGEIIGDIWNVGTNYPTTKFYYYDLASVYVQKEKALKHMETWQPGQNKRNKTKKDEL